MSCFVVSDNHIDYLVSAASLWLERDYGNEFAIKPKDLAQLLELENWKSYAHRYCESAPAQIARNIKVLTKVDPVQVLKAVACYEYQSCEHPGWEESKARLVCQKIRNSAISRLPGYETAEWAIR